MLEIVKFGEGESTTSLALWCYVFLTDYTQDIPSF